MSNIDTATPALDSGATVPLHVVHGDPVEIAGGVFVIPDGRMPLVPNIGIIIGERAALVGGKLSIDSAVGRGTEVRVQLPIVPTTERST